MINYKHLSFLFFMMIFILSFIFLGCQAVENPVYALRQNVESTGSPVIDMFKNVPVLNLLGKSFDEIKQVLGEPDEHGYSGMLGPHYYMLYRHKEGVMRFCSPESKDNKIATRIIMGPGQEVLGAKVGMLFPEIIDILGTPDFAPELGIDSLYYMVYFLGEINHQTPEVLISFSAVEMNSPTLDVFIKWEAYDYYQTELLQAERTSY